MAITAPRWMSVYFTPATSKASMLAFSFFRA
jgi:hypothetical protein